MKLSFRFPVLLLSLALSGTALAGTPAKITGDSPIPADSKSPYDFRGQPNATIPLYEALFRTKTYGELRLKLEAFLQDSDSQTEHDDPTDYYLARRCRVALMRVYYLLSEVEKADKILDDQIRY